MTMTTNRPLTIDFEGLPLQIPSGAECILVKDAHFDVILKKRIDGYALTNPEKFGAYLHDAKNHYAYVPADAVSGILADAVLVRKAHNIKSDNWRDNSDRWLVNINGQHFDFFTGTGLRDNRAKNPQTPSLDSVLACLLSDANLATETFQDFCDNLGYNPDSRKALDTYLECQNTAVKLRKAGINIEKESERLADF